MFDEYMASALPAWLADAPLHPGGRYHLSTEPVEGFRPVPEQFVDFKPEGLWYGCGTAWLDYLTHAIPKRLSKAKYLYEVKPGPGVLYIPTAGALRYFDANFGVGPQSKMSDRKVDWNHVAEHFTGIEICPYQKSCRHAFFWYYTWDVASGCLWGPGAHMIRLIAQSPGAVL